MFPQETISDALFGIAAFEKKKRYRRLDFKRLMLEIERELVRSGFEHSTEGFLRWRIRRGKMICKALGCTERTSYRGFNAALARRMRVYQSLYRGTPSGLSPRSLGTARDFLDRIQRSINARIVGEARARFRATRPDAVIF